MVVAQLCIVDGFNVQKSSSQICMRHNVNVSAQQKYRVINMKYAKQDMLVHVCVIIHIIKKLKNKLEFANHV